MPGTRSSRLAAGAAAFAIVLLNACGQPRRIGDPDGVPTTFVVHLERAFVNDMANRQARVGVGVGVGVGSGGHSGFGTGVGIGFSSTEVYLLGGDQPGNAQLFRKEIGWGETRFTVPLRPGRTLALTVQAEGGRVGWEGVGSATLPATSATVTVTLDAQGPHIVVDPPPAPAPTPAPDAGSAATTSTTPTAATPAPDAAPAPAPTTSP